MTTPPLPDTPTTPVVPNLRMVSCPSMSSHDFALLLLLQALRFDAPCSIPVLFRWPLLSHSSVLLVFIQSLYYFEVPFLVIFCFDVHFSSHCSVFSSSSVKSVLFFLVLSFRSPLAQRLVIFHSVLPWASRCVFYPIRLYSLLSSLA